MQTTTTATCQDCGRKITAAASIAAGRGSGCRAKVRAAARAAIATAKAAQLDKANELIDDNGIVRISRFGEFAAKSSDGTRAYVVDVPACACDCPAGEHGRYCYHLLAGQIITAAARPVRLASVRSPRLAYAFPALIAA